MNHSIYNVISNLVMIVCVPKDFLNNWILSAQSSLVVEYGKNVQDF